MWRLGGDCEEYCRDPMLGMALDPTTLHPMPAMALLRPCEVQRFKASELKFQTLSDPRHSRVETLSAQTES